MPQDYHTNAKTNSHSLSVFYLDYKNDKNGRPAYDPAILLKIIPFR